MHRHVSALFEPPECLVCPVFNPLKRRQASLPSFPHISWPTPHSEAGLGSPLGASLCADQINHTLDKHHKLLQVSPKPHQNQKYPVAKCSCITLTLSREPPRWFFYTLPPCWHSSVFRGLADLARAARACVTGFTSSALTTAPLQSFLWPPSRRQSALSKLNREVSLGGWRGWQRRGPALQFRDFFRVQFGNFHISPRFLQGKKDNVLNVATIDTILHIYQRLLLFPLQNTNQRHVFIILCEQNNIKKTDSTDQLGSLFLTRAHFLNSGAVFVLPEF